MGRFYDDCTIFILNFINVHIFLRVSMLTWCNLTYWCFLWCIKKTFSLYSFDQLDQSVRDSFKILAWSLPLRCDDIRDDKPRKCLFVYISRHANTTKKCNNSHQQQQTQTSGSNKIKKYMQIIFFVNYFSPFAISWFHSHHMYELSFQTFINSISNQSQPISENSLFFFTSDFVSTLVFTIIIVIIGTFAHVFVPFCFNFSFLSSLRTYTYLHESYEFHDSLKQKKIKVQKCERSVTLLVERIK